MFYRGRRNSRRKSLAECSMKGRHLFQLEKEKGRKEQEDRAMFSTEREREGARRNRSEMSTVTADSGAADHVAPVGTADHLEIKETEASRQGVKYVAANSQKRATRDKG